MYNLRCLCLQAVRYYLPPFLLLLYCSGGISFFANYMFDFFISFHQQLLLIGSEVCSTHLLHFQSVNLWSASRSFEESCERVIIRISYIWFGLLSLAWPSWNTLSQRALMGLGQASLFVCYLGCLNSTFVKYPQGNRDHTCLLTKADKTGKDRR